jgi:hypothetical protein
MFISREETLLSGVLSVPAITEPDSPEITIHTSMFLKKDKSFPEGEIRVDHNFFR